MEQTIYTPFEQLPQVHFGANWNRKLQNKIFSTIRLISYEPGTLYAIILSGTFMHRSRCLKVYETKLDKLTDYICYLDTGESAEKTKDIIKALYNGRNIDWSSQKVFINLFENIEY